MQGCEFRITASIAADQVQRGYGHIEPRSLGIFQSQELRIGAVHRQGLQANVTADTVFDMNHRHPFAQFV